MKALFTVALCVLAALLLIPGSARSVNVSDFQINEENYPTIFDHFQHAVADDGSGNYVVTWVDNRADHPRYYAQLFNWYGTPVGENILILDDPVGPEPVAVARNSGGDFVVVYIHGDGVYAKKYNSSGSMLWGPQLLQHLDWMTCWYCYRGPFVAMSSSGHILTGWVQLDTTHAVFTPMGQWLDNGGQKVGSPFAVFGPAGQAPSSLRAVVTNDNVAAVAQLLGSTVQIRFVPFGSEPTGTVDTLATTVGVFGEGTHGIPSGIELCHLTDGSLYAAWKMQFDSTIQIYSGGYILYNAWGHDYVRRYDGMGTPLSESVSLEPEADHSSKRSGLSISPQGSGFTLSDFGVGDDSTVFVRRYTADATPLGSDQVLTTQRKRQYQSALGQITLSTGLIGFVWTTTGLMNNNEVVRQHFSPAGSSLGPAQRVHDDMGANQTNPRIVTGSDGTSLTLWIDYRNNADGDLYGQRYDRAGNKIGANFKLNDSGHANYFTVGGNGTDRAVVMWSYISTVFSRVYPVQARVLDGPALGMNSASFLVEPRVVEVSSFGGDIGVAADGRFVLAYHLATSDSPSVQLYVRRYSADLPPAPLTDRIRLGTGNLQPAVGMNSDGTFAISWLTTFPWRPRFQRFTADCIAIDTAITIVGDNPCASRSTTRMAVNSRGEFAVAWGASGCYPGNGAWIAMFDSAGHQSLNWTRLTDGSWGDFIHSIDVATLPDNSFMAFYQDLACCDSAVWAQRFTAAGPVGSRLQISSDAGSAIKQNPDLAVVDSTVLFVWEDFRNGRGNSDIFARYLDLAGVPGDVDGSGQIDISDLTLLVDYLFLLLQMPPNFWLADMNGDGVVDVGDVTTMVDYLF